MRKFFTYIIAGLIGGFVVLGGNYILNSNNSAKTSYEDQTISASKVNADIPKFPFSFKKAAGQATPAVVHILAEESEKMAEQRYNERSPRGIEQLFGKGMLDDFLWGGGKQFYRQKGAGSGVIYSKNGYIVTNNHVVGFADKIEVTLPDKRKFQAIKIGTDPSTDLAVLKIEAENLPTLEIANSDQSEVGEWVLAVGNPFDYLTSTVTAGIISAKGRNLNIIEDDKAIEEFIQTDAAINPGNSGGALVDSEGRLLGINTAIATPTGTYAGYSFAIPSNLMKRIVDEIIENGDIEGATLGVQGYSIVPEVVKEYELEIENGFYVDQVASGSSAQFAGIIPGDIIVRVEDSEIKVFDDLVKVLKFVRAGDVINVKVFRDNKYKNITVKLKKGI